MFPSDPPHPHLRVAQNPSMAQEEGDSPAFLPMLGHFVFPYYSSHCLHLGPAINRNLERIWHRHTRLLHGRQYGRRGMNCWGAVLGAPLHSHETCTAAVNSIIAAMADAPCRPIRRRFGAGKNMHVHELAVNTNLMRF